jgi:hypothetical protein
MRTRTRFTEVTQWQNSEISREISNHRAAWKKLQIAAEVRRKGDCSQNQCFQLKNTGRTPKNKIPRGETEKPPKLLTSHPKHGVNRCFESGRTNKKIDQPLSE